MEGATLPKVIREGFTEEQTARKALESEKHFVGKELGEVALMCNVLKFPYSFSGDSDVKHVISLLKICLDFLMAKHILNFV